MHVASSSYSAMITAGLLVLLLVQCFVPAQASALRPAGVRQAIELLSKKGQAASQDVRTCIGNDHAV